VELNRSQNKWEWCARHSDVEWQLLCFVKGEAIDALAASDEPLDYAILTPITAARAPTSSSKRARSSEVTSLDDGPLTKKRRLGEASVSASKSSNTLTAPVEDNDPTLVSALVPSQANGDAPIVEQPRSGAEPVAEAQTIEGEVPEERSTHRADGDISDVSVVPESPCEPSPFIPVRSPSIRLVPSSKVPKRKRKWHPTAFHSTQAVADDDYFGTPPGSPHPHGAVVGPASVPLNQNQIQADTVDQRGARDEEAEVESLDLDFEEVDREESAVVTFEQNVNTTDYPEEPTARNEPRMFSTPTRQTSTTAANGVPRNILDEYQHPMPQYSDVLDVFSHPPVEDSTRGVIRSWLVTASKSQQGSQPVEEGLTSGRLDQGDSPATRDTQFFEKASGTLRAVDGHSQSPLPSSSAPHSPISSMLTRTPTSINAPLQFTLAKRNGGVNHLRTSPNVSDTPRTNARAPPRGAPIPVLDPPPIRQSSPPQLRKDPRAERRRTFGGWSTILATSSLRKEEAKISSTRRKRRDSTPALPATMVYRDQQEDADWLRSVEKKVKIIPRYTDPRKRIIPPLLPETSSDDTNTANGSDDEDDLAEKVSKISSLDIERIMNVLNVAPRNKVLKRWKRQNKSDAWITWNGLDLVLEELADRFKTGVTAAREAWAAAGDLVVTEKALHQAQEMARRTVMDVIKSEAEEASKRRMESWAASAQTSERWGGTSRRSTRLYPRDGGRPEFVPAEAVQVAMEAASSPWNDRGVKQGSSKVLREALDELPMLSFDGVGPGGVSILRE